MQRMLQNIQNHKNFLPIFVGFLHKVLFNVYLKNGKRSLGENDKRLNSHYITEALAGNKLCKLFAIICGYFG